MFYIDRIVSLRPDKEVLELLKLNIENNYFIFNQWLILSTNFRHINGQKIPPNYANIFMAKLEEETL